jgi:hypothetical protein
MYLPLSAQVLLPISRSLRTFLRIAFVCKPRYTENGHMNQMHLTVRRTEQNYFHARFLRAPPLCDVGSDYRLAVNSTKYVYLFNHMTSLDVGDWL